MRANFRMQRLFVSDRLDTGRRISLEPAQTHYLANVLRLRASDAVLVFNGRDGEWRARLDTVEKKRVVLQLNECTRQQTPPPDLVYCFAPLKIARLDYLVQKAVEMGCGTLQPVLTQHTQVHKLSVHRIAKNVIEAAEQCGILSLPQVEEPVRLDRLLAGWDPERRLIFCDEAHDEQNPLSALGTVAESKLALLIGPEGGFSEVERKQLHACGFVTAIPLGPRILRADTAAVAALSLIQAAIGDWR